MIQNLLIRKLQSWKQRISRKLATEAGWLTDRVRDQLAQCAPPRKISEIPKEIAEVLVTAHEIAPE